MRKRTTTAWTSWAIAAVGALALAAPAQAALTVTTSGGASYVGGPARVSTTDPPTFSNSAGGIFTFNRTGGTAPALMPDNDTVGQFIGICLEFNEGYTANGSYQLVSLGAAPVAGTAAGTMSNSGLHGTRAHDLARFLGHVYPVFGGAVLNVASGLTAAQAALAVQLVVWEIAGENYASNSYGLDTGLLRVSTSITSSAARNQAVAWLNALATDGGGWTPARNLFALINDQRPGQDFVVQVVPIPAAAWLLGSGLLGLFVVARRRKPVAP